VVFAFRQLRERTEPGDPSDVRVPVASTESFLSRAQAGRLAALLYLGSSAASILSLPFPQPAGADRWHLLIISAVALAIGVVAWFAPWGRWPRPATLALVPPALALIALGNVVGGSVPYTYSVFFVVVFVWIGVVHRRGWALAMAPLAALAYVLPLPHLTNDPGPGFASTALVVPVCVLVGESLAWAGARFRQQQTALLHTEERFRLLVEGIDDYAIVMLDPQGTIVSWNAGARQINGYESDEIVGRHLSTFHPVDDVRQGRPDRLLADAAASGHVAYEGWHVRADGSRFLANVHLTALRDENGDLRGFASITRDVTERRAAEDLERQTLEALRRVDGERRRLLSRLVRAQEDERRRVAADIHDDTVQVMSAVAMRLDLLHQQVTDDELRRIVLESAGVVHSSIERLRRMIFTLRPAALDEEGLAAAVGAYVAEQDAVAAGPSVRVENRLVDELPGDLRILAYRVVQEALANAYKHAGASHVHVCIEPTRGGVSIRVRDDGRGFAADGAHPTTAGHIGLAAMREHAQMAGGRCVVRSAPGWGTTVEAWFPLDWGVAPPTETTTGIAS
jgi:PAS domain S-box-containing protein